MSRELNDFYSETCETKDPLNVFPDRGGHYRNIYKPSGVAFVIQSIFPHANCKVFKTAPQSFELTTLYNKSLFEVWQGCSGSEMRK